MSNYRRARVPGGTYFFTLVTFNRKPLFLAEAARRCLREAISEVRIDRQFKLDGFCLLPDHLHTIWTLPEGDSNYSQRWSAIKAGFSRRFHLVTDSHVKTKGSRSQRGEVSIWQRRFWEHLIRDDKDFRQHLDYIHYNPVKHGYAKSVLDWPWSSFHRYVKLGAYTMDWAGSTQAKLNLVTVGE